MQRWILFWALLALLSVPGGSQTVERAPAELVNYPDLIVYNGKIVAMSDPSFNQSVGTVAEAMAVRNGRILELGGNSKIRGLAGPQTKQIDLKGRTVLPGLISTHEHTQEYAFGHEPLMRRAFTDDDLVARWVRGNTIEEIINNFEGVLREAASKVKPNQWIRLELFRGTDDQFRTPLTQLLQKDQRINKFLIDNIAPSNPVAVKSGISMLINEVALKQYNTLYPPKGPLTVNPRTGLGGTKLYRRTENDLVFAGRMDLLARLYKEELSWWAGYGFTTIVSHNEGFQMYGGYRYLDKSGEMPIRYGWGYRDYPLSTDPLALRRISDMVGTGSDFLWLVGMHSYEGGDCTTATAPPEVKKKEECNFAPGSPGADEVYRIVSAGGRLATMHTSGDKDIDNLLDIIEKASKDAGFSLDEIRAKRHVFDHCHLAPRPDQIERIKRLGMMMSCQITILNEPQSEEYLKDYGPTIADKIIPQKLMADHGLMNTFEIDRPIGHTKRNAFFFHHLSITRRNEKGQVIGPSQKIDRVTSLKTTTTWAAYYTLREKLLGSLEPGKFADFIVLDRDYLTIPEDDIPKIRVLMTVLGGKVTHLFPEMAGEIGTQAVGTQALVQ